MVAERLGRNPRNQSQMGSDNGKQNAAATNDDADGKQLFQANPHRQPWTKGEATVLSKVNYIRLESLLLNALSGFPSSACVVPTVGNERMTCRDTSSNSPGDSRQLEVILYKSSEGQIKLADDVKKNMAKKVKQGNIFAVDVAFRSPQMEIVLNAFSDVSFNVRQGKDSSPQHAVRQFFEGLKGTKNLERLSAHYAVYGSREAPSQAVVELMGSNDPIKMRTPIKSDRIFESDAVTCRALTEFFSFEHMPQSSSTGSGVGTISTESKLKWSPNAQQYMLVEQWGGQRHSTERMYEIRTPADHAAFCQEAEASRSSHRGGRDADEGGQTGGMQTELLASGLPRNSRFGTGTL